MNPAKPVLSAEASVESEGRRELGDLYAFVEMGEEATLDRLVEELGVQERLDGMIDRCIKRLLVVRGIKSISVESTSSPPRSISGPSKVA